MSGGCGTLMEMIYLKDKETDGIRLTQEEIEAYARSLDERGLQAVSIQNYRAILKSLYLYLPEDKRICQKTPAEWVDYLKRQGYGVRTVNARISVLNSFLQYMGKREWQSREYQRQPEDIQPELSRAEYRLLLKKAKELGRERDYLLIKTMGGAGVRVQELSQMTVEAVREGTLLLSCHNQRRMLHLPAALQKELLAYAGRERRPAGPVFADTKGAPLSRYSVHHGINRIGREAGVSEEKTNPRCLWRMYQRTYEGIQVCIEKIAEQAYGRMIEEEQLILGWEV